MHPFLIEAFVLLAIGLVLGLLRIFTRISLVGFRWKGDDYLILISGALVFLSVWATYRIFSDPTLLLPFTEQQVEDDPNIQKTIKSHVIYKFVNWFTYATELWLLKGCMLFFYRRVTESLLSKRLFIIFGVVLIVTYIAIFGSLFALFKCNPATRHLSGGENKKCTQLTIVFFLVGFLNVLTDLMLLSIPLPFLWNARLTIWKKARVATLLCGGVLVIVASILRTILVVKGDADVRKHPSHEIKYIGGATMLGARELFVAHVVVNAPVISPLFHRRFWNRFFTKTQDVSELMQSKLRSSEDYPSSPPPPPRRPPSPPPPLPPRPRAPEVRVTRPKSFTRPNSLAASSMYSRPYDVEYGEFVSNEPLPYHLYSPVLVRGSEPIMSFYMSGSSLDDLESELNLEDLREKYEKEKYISSSKTNEHLNERPLPPLPTMRYSK